MAFSCSARQFGTFNETYDECIGLYEAYKFAEFRGCKRAIGARLSSAVVALATLFQEEHDLMPHPDGEELTDGAIELSGLKISPKFCIRQYVHPESPVLDRVELESAAAKMSVVYFDLEIQCFEFPVPGMGYPAIQEDVFLECYDRADLTLQGEQRYTHVPLGGLVVLGRG